MSPYNPHLNSPDPRFGLDLHQIAYTQFAWFCFYQDPAIYIYLLFSNITQNSVEECFVGQSKTRSIFVDSNQGADPEIEFLLVSSLDDYIK